jgi:hypothetical protein
MVTPNVEDTTRFTHTLGTLFNKSWGNLVKVTNMVKEIGQDDPRRVIHSFKVGLALVLIYILHHFRPSFYGFRENIIWAVLTVVLVFEFSVGKYPLIKFLLLKLTCAINFFIILKLSYSRK